MRTLPHRQNAVVSGGRDPVLIVAAGDAKIDNPKYKAQFGTKAKMLTPEQRRRSSAMRWAASARLPSTPGVAVYLDVSLRRFETVFPRLRQRHSAIELTIPELEQYSGCKQWVDVCKAWQAEKPAVNPKPRGVPWTPRGFCGHTLYFMVHAVLFLIDGVAGQVHPPAFSACRCPRWRGSPSSARRSPFSLAAVPARRRQTHSPTPSSTAR